jgi:hypothetical protein
MSPMAAARDYEDVETERPEVREAREFRTALIRAGEMRGIRGTITRREEISCLIEEVVADNQRQSCSF